MDGINTLLISGALERVQLRFREDGTAICTGTLRCEEVGTNHGTVFRLFCPWESYGKLAESMGERLAGDLVLLQGKVFWRKYVTKSGEEKSGLALLVQKCSVLVSQEVPA